MARKKQPKYIIDGIKYLEQSDMNKLEVFHRETRIKELELQLVSKDSEVLSEKRQKLSSQLETVNKELEIVALKKKLVTYEQNVGNSSYKQYLAMLQEKYEIAGKFGYDPDSGEIKE